MASVYLCEDVKHDRKVALKLLKPELAAVLGAERFVVEIKTTAGLQHPHILPLFDSGTADGFLFYVMPFIEGETLRDKLNRETQLGIDDAVRIAREVLDALQYAHEHGIVHRDVKPENILLHGGHAMVADFGIALAVSAAAGGRMTETGLSLGTPHYMSPEQATAEKEITARSDVYSLSSVLFEMLTGQPPHLGGSAQQIIMKIITEQAPPVTQLRKSVPANVAAAVAKALEKLPADRFASAKAFGEALANPSFTTGVAAHAGAASSLANRGVSRRAFWTAAAVVVFMTLIATVALLRPRSVPYAPVVRVHLEMPPGERMYTSFNGAIAVSPQGDRIAYVTTGSAGLHTVVRRTNELAGRALSVLAARNLVFSPDGHWLAYTEVAGGTEVKKVLVDGGASVTLWSAPPGAGVRGLSWGVNDTIVVCGAGGLWAVSSSGGKGRRLFPADSASTTLTASPVVLPDNRTIAFVTGTSGDAFRLAVGSLGASSATVFDIRAAAPLGFQDGRLLYVTPTGALMALPVDLARGRATGDPVQVEDSVLIAQGNALYGVVASLSASGTLAFVHGASTSQLVLSGGGRTDSPVIAELHAYSYPRFSPDGRKIAVAVTGASTDIWVYDLAARTFTRLTTEGANSVPEWSPDGTRILWRSERNGKRAVWWQPADGSAKAELLYQPDELFNEAFLSPDAKWLVYRFAPGTRHSRDIVAVPLSGDRKPIVLVSGSDVHTMPRLSPDGRWLAYQSNVSGRSEVYVRPFPNSGATVQVSNEGGTEPLWPRSGRGLIYRTSAGFVSVAVTTGKAFTIGERRSVLTGVYVTDPVHPMYDLAPDGQQFLLLKQAGNEAVPVLVHNWGQELREKLAAGKKP